MQLPVEQLLLQFTEPTSPPVVVVRTREKRGERMRKEGERREDEMRWRERGRGREDEKGGREEGG